MATITLQEIWPLLKSFYAGFREFRREAETPQQAYWDMRLLYARTNGWFNDLFQVAYGLVRPYKPVPTLANSILPGFTRRDVRHAVKQIEKDGYYVFPQLIADEYLDNLMEYSLKAPANLQFDGEMIKDTGTRFDPNRLVASNYRFPEKDVITNLTVQRIMADPVVLSIAQQYIKSQIKLVNVQMWWTTPFACTSASSSLAQLFHFDMDRIKFLKFFLYVTDVSSKSGPHSYVRGSCKRKPRALLEDRRFQDEEIQAHYRPEDILEILGRRGTLIASDTRGFHKAKVPTEGNRLVLQLEIANCLFGQNYPHEILEPKDAGLVLAIKNDPATWANYRIAAKSAQLRDKVSV